MMPPLLALMQAVTAPVAGPPVDPKAIAVRYERCVDLAVSKPSEGVTEASQWQMAGGGHLARQCLGIAYAAQQRWPSAADAFTGAARDAELVKDTRAATYWAQAGNAWLAGGDPAKSRAALDAALAAGTLNGLALGEAHLDRARALVAGGDLAGARGDLDLALKHAAADPLAWLLSATLARRTQNLARARLDIAEAVRLSPDDVSVQLEAGNIAAITGDADGAKAAWTRAAMLGPGTEQAILAAAALKQFAPDKAE